MSPRPRPRACGAPIIRLGHAVSSGGPCQRSICGMRQADAFNGRHRRRSRYLRSGCGQVDKRNTAPRFVPQHAATRLE